MEARPLSYVVRACGGRLLQGSDQTLVTRVCSDSRDTKAGDLFVALKGERFDAHAFIAEAAKQPIAGVLAAGTWTPDPDVACAVVAVDDPRRALGRLASAYRREFAIPMVAVCGSNGKTTTKNLLASVLREQGAVLASERSFNNDVGVPMTLLQLNGDHRAAVLEAGTNHPGELAPLLAMIRPRYGVLTTLGPEHLEYFGDMDGVIEEESELGRALPPDGLCFVNGDTPGVERFAGRCAARVVRAGFGSAHPWRADNARVETSGMRFEVRSAARPEFDGTYSIRLWGRHQVTNALLALAAGAELGVGPETARQGLAACAPASMRMELWNWRGAHVLDDGYNANEESVKAALATLRDWPGARRRLAVLGDMAELGEQSAIAHRAVGEFAGTCGLDGLIAVGAWSRETVEAARAAGLRDAETARDIESAGQRLLATVQTGDVILLKASRAAGFEGLGRWMRSQAESSRPGGGDRP